MAISSKTNSFSASLSPPTLHLASKVTFWEQWFPMQSEHQSEEIYEGNISFQKTIPLQTNIKVFLNFWWILDIFACCQNSDVRRLTSPWWDLGEQLSMRSQVKKKRILPSLLQTSNILFLFQQSLSLIHDLIKPVSSRFANFNAWSPLSCFARDLSWGG